MDPEKAEAGHRHHGAPAPNDLETNNPDHTCGSANQQAALTPSRRRLAARRQCEHFNFECGGIQYTASVGRFPDGTLGEVFIVSGKAGSAADTAARDAAIAASIAFQHGADQDNLREALCRNSRGEANGPLGAAMDIIAERAR